MKRGDVYLVDLDPTKGREQAGKRFVVIVSSEAFNKWGPQLICPLTQGGDFARQRGFTVPLAGFGTQSQGVVLCNQLRTIDLQARSAKFIERLPELIMVEVVAKVQTLLD